MLHYIFLCPKCGHVQKNDDCCEMCQNEELHFYVRSFNPSEQEKLKTWTEKLAKKRATYHSPHRGDKPAGE